MQVYNECIGCAYNPDIHVTDVSIHFIVIVKSWHSCWISMSPLLMEYGDPIRLKPMTKDEKMCFVSQDGSTKMLDIQIKMEIH